ncbi:hypothetical protein [Caballeronia sp. dw_276]|jgi:hypothetical protein|uniref:hypothetical protein n=1 Tax=Caballeronia sp. dw_276 TaxID=2719795 RepID=UPI001BD2BAA1|nr:hypothetical protein [Caballeronia sp. dw_276]
MSRPPIRDVFRLAHLGLEKVALACAAFSLMHATARADESAPPEPVTVDQWAAQSGAQSVGQRVGRDVREDPWANPAAARLAHDDPWSAPSANQGKLGEQLHVATPAPQTTAAATQTLQRPQPSSALVMDSSDWNEMPRGRSPGLIASNNAWRKRIVPESAEAVERGVAAHDQRTQPAAVLKLDSGLQLDPWSAPTASSKGADNAADWKNLNLASAHQPRTCDRDWSIFSGAACVDSKNPADPVKDNLKSKPLPGAQSSRLEETGNGAIFRQSRMLTAAMASGDTPRSSIAITPDGRWRAPLVLEAAARK